MGSDFCLRPTVQDRPSDRPKTGSSVGKSFGLKRLGTVINRRKSMHPYDQAGSPERKKSSSNLGPFKRRHKEKAEPSDPTPIQSLEDRSISETARPDSEPTRSAVRETLPVVKENGVTGEESSTSQIGSGLVNGAESSSGSKLQEPLQPTPAPDRKSSAEIPSKPATDGQGFSIPPIAATDPITLAEQEAAL